MNCSISNLRDNMNNFFNCTNIPIKSFSTDGTEVFSFGHTDHKKEIHFNIFSKNKIKELSDALKTKSHIIYEVSTNINFAICSVCNDSLNCGIFILGPYRIDEKSNFDITFKPKECITYILDLLYSIIHSSKKHSLELVKPQSECNLYVNKAIKYIEENYKTQISLESISTYLGINKSYFCDVFKKTTDKTFIQFLNEFRIEKSKDLLINNNASITEISLSIGFSSPNYFNTQFKKITGYTPSNYIKKVVE